MPEQDCSFQADERMKLRKNIETLFQKGEAFSVFPFRVIHLRAIMNESVSYPIRVGISVPKKRHSKAVSRNKIKRLIKEAWRTSKSSLYQQLGDNQQIHCFLIYQTHKTLTFEEIKATIIKIQNKLAEVYTIHP